MKRTKFLFIISILTLFILTLLYYNNNDCKEHMEDIEDSEQQEITQNVLSTKESNKTDQTKDTSMTFYHGKGSKGVLEYRLMIMFENNRKLSGKYLFFMGPLRGGYDNKSLYDTINLITQSQDLYGGFNKIFINWIFNFSKFQYNMNYNLYSILFNKYMELPLDSTDYETPLLDNEPYSRDNVKPSNFDYVNSDDNKSYESPMDLTNKLCSDRVLYLKKISFNNYSYVRLNNDILILNLLTIINFSNRASYNFMETPYVTTFDDERQYLLGEVKSMININWKYVLDRIKDKTKKLLETMINECNYEMDRTNLDIRLNISKINLYQLFNFLIIIEKNEPYIYSIESNPFTQIYTNEPWTKYLSKFHDDFIKILNLS